MYEDLINRLHRMLDWELIDYDANFKFADETIAEAANAIEKLSKPSWIPVAERLPEDNERVLIRSGDYVGCGIYTGEFWKDEEYDYVIVTHWQPLPEPPKEGT